MLDGHHFHERYIQYIIHNIDPSTTRNDGPTGMTGITNMILESYATTTSECDVSCVPKSDISKCDLIDGRFPPQEIKSAYIAYAGSVLVVNKQFGNTSIRFHIMDPATNRPRRFLSDLKQMFPIINTIVSQSGIDGIGDPTNTIGAPLEVFLYMSPLEKVMPTTYDTILSGQNCNSAVTRTCSPSGQMLIYREEEWTKTLIHELFHNMCLDTSIQHDDTMNQYIETIFHLPGKPSFRETYCEWWATILTCARAAMACIEEGVDRTTDREQFRLLFDTFVSMERTHAMFQVSKITRYWGVEWCDFLKHGMCDDPSQKRDRPTHDIPKEATHVFCYYILKCILLFDPYSTVDFFALNNPNILQRGRVDAWGVRMRDMIRKIAYGEDFELAVQRYDRIFQLTLNRMRRRSGPTAVYIETSMRMSLLSNYV